jgi:hypothetical protein
MVKIKRLTILSNEEAMKKLAPPYNIGSNPSTTIPSRI